MKSYLLFVFAFVTTTSFALNFSQIPHLRAASDLDCLINMQYKLSKKERQTVRQNLLDAASKTENETTIFTLFALKIPEYKLTSASLEKECIVNRLFANQETLTTYLTSSNTITNTYPKRSFVIFTENQVQNLLTLLELRTVFVLKYAYFDEKKMMFNAQWEKAVEQCLTDDKVKLRMIIESVLNPLEDPHVSYKVLKSEKDIPYVVKNKMIYVFPFRFDVHNNEIFIWKKAYMSSQLPNDNALIEDKMKILAIDGIASKKWIDSLDKTDGPFLQKRDFMLQNMLFLYYIYEKPTVFTLQNAKGASFDVTVERSPIDRNAYKKMFWNPQLASSVDPKQRLHFRYIDYAEQSNKSLKTLIDAAQSKDTLVFDFRGYPERDVYRSSQLLWGTAVKDVAYSLLKNAKTGCFDVREEMNSYDKKQFAHRTEIEQKQLVVFGIIGEETASYVETAAMTFKTYTPNFMLIGAPTAGALGTIDFEKIGDGGQVTYPYHKFIFYDKKQVNQKSQTLPDLPMSKEAIDVFLTTGQLPSN
jgi:hypothetical protein